VGVVEFDLQVVLAVLFEGDFGDGVDGGLVEPAVDDQLSVEPDAHAVVSEGDELVGFGVVGAELAGPADGELVGSGEKHRVGDGLVPVVVDGGVGADQRELLEVSADEVFAAEAVAFLGRDGGTRSEVEPGDGGEGEEFGAVGSGDGGLVGQELEAAGVGLAVARDEGAGAGGEGEANYGEGGEDSIRHRGALTIACTGIWGKGSVMCVSKRHARLKWAFRRAASGSGTARGPFWGAGSDPALDLRWRSCRW
jgi:hypothetical protein